MIELMSAATTIPTRALAGATEEASKRTRAQACAIEAAASLPWKAK